MAATPAPVDTATAFPESPDPRHPADAADAVEQERLPSRTSIVARQYARRDYYLRRLLALSDCLGLTLALVFAASVDTRPAWRSDVLVGLATLPAWLVLFTLYGLYERDTKRVSHSSIDDLPVLFHAVLVGSLLLWLYYRIVQGGAGLFTTMLPFAPAALVLLLTGRSATRSICSRRLDPERVLLIGSSPSLLSLAEKMEPGRGLRLTPVGILLGRGTPKQAVHLPVLGHIHSTDLRDILVVERVGRIVMADSDLDEARALEVLRECKELQVKVSLLPAMFSALGQATEIDDVLGITLLGINPPVLSRSARGLKRALDVVGSVLLLVLLSPLLLVCALAIRLDSRGPALFRQVRVGRGSRRFRLYKFRTMVADAEAQHAALLAQSADPDWLLLEEDPRVTRVGRFLRVTSIDELPQLLNVLGGQMSLVGPRPLIVSEDNQIGGWARGRLDLTPGMTGLWQVLGRTRIPFEEMVKLDYLYVTNWSLWSDIRLILRTMPAVFARRGAN